MILPMVLFISSGLLDTLIVYVKNNFFINPTDNFNDFLISAFSVAGAIGTVVLIIQGITGKQKFSGKALFGRYYNWRTQLFFNLVFRKGNN